jgi:glycosyltransferase involved in cell wall biosynthesis
MPKILFLGHYREGSSGWAQVTRNYILGLDKAGYDVVCRPVRLNEKSSELPPRILELEQKSDKDCDVIIQMTLPHLMEYSGNFKKCLGVFFSETNSLPLEWSSKLSLMDELWVCNNQMIRALENSGVTTPYKLIRPPVDTSRYEQTYSSYKGLKERLEGSYSFLWLGDLSKRKNLSAVLKAFHSEFKYEPVELVIKSSKFGLSPEQVTQTIQQLSNEVKTGLKLYPNLNDYKSEIIISGHLSDTEICELHSTVDSLVSVPCGEAWGQSILDGLGFGNIVIGSEVGGPADYLDGLNQYESDGEYWSDWKEHANSLVVYKHTMIEEPCFGMVDGFQFLFNSDESWYNPSISELRKLMRTAYEMSEDTKKILRKNALDTIYDFSYENFGESVQELI